MKAESIKNTIKENNLSVFTPRDLQRFLEVTKNTAQKIAERYTDKGVFTRLKRGYYALSADLPHSFYVANCIYKPSYISFESALSYYGLIPESVYAVTSATFKNTKTFEALEKNFEYSKIKKQAFKGYRKEVIEGNKVLIAEPEKAVADYFYLGSLGKKDISERLTSEELDKQKLSEYLELFARNKLKDFSKKHL